MVLWHEQTPPDVSHEHLGAPQCDGRVSIAAPFVRKSRKGGELFVSDISYFKSREFTIPCIINSAEKRRISMVLSVVKYNIHPDKTEAFQAWVQQTIPRILGLAGVVEFRAYRPASGSWQVVSTTEFSDMAAWASVVSGDVWQQINNELHTLALDITVEVWGPSPVVPKPLRAPGN
jgi:quinol monooxygenase YgiN